MRHAPAVRRKKLGSELRRLRDKAGVTSREAALLVGWHQSKVSRIETGRSGIKLRDLSMLLEAYDVTDPELCAMLTALAGADAPATDVGPGPGQGHAPHNGRRTGGAGGVRRGWWYAYRDLLPPAYRDFISLESDAVRERTLETTVVPGLLQTEAYAREVTRAALGGVGPRARIESLVEVRGARQSVLWRSPPLALDVVLDEAVLRREVGGCAVMREQLRALARAAELPHVRLQVLPFASGVHIGVTGPFVIFSFSSISDLDVVVLDHLTSSLYLEEHDELRAYCAAFDTLRAHALSYEDSLAFIARTAEGT
ncbi:MULTISPECIES: helix-turn-helix transcriptional regulator [unclassified Streptomyces]|uniref:helix-turn-helix domain-containing protein n=1 Tax=unclassified Streptomyces TaxID=2593676 RepID=UPI002DD7B325|nr:MULTISPECIES: helix-turn-helix transcriptional regulator [unclassified Streptomyces]WSA96780.1 helix-turn-helix transcriptional regulator [Streptomyces sp. NBC_01795]WSB81196.1 helix-turn-helix transcriptional regulator [Streptomyces sp. NBC_01775]WSS10596.1 helix-turn-helix transcriptional regulator [Streptomyces sp. NBC_01186]WSS39290.1 helix-turn-helix transcriptional regulator [Streptomyces sp. NBC_01187]